MKNIIFLILFCSALFCDSAICQKNNIKEGYIVLIDGDTLSGKIKEQSSLAHSEFLFFKKETSEEFEKYYPSQVPKYFFDDFNYYEAHSIPFVGTGGELEYQRLFLKKLIEGEIELFRLDYEIEESPAPFFDYQKKYYFLRKEPNTALISLLEDDYKVKIKSIFKNSTCQLSKRNKRFDDAGLTSYILEYSDCSGRKTKLLYTPEKKAKGSWGISAGYTRPRINLSDKRFKEFTIENGRGFDVNLFFLSAFSKHLSGRFGLTYQNRSQDGQLNHVVSEFYDNEGEVLDLRSETKFVNVVIPFDVFLNKRINNFNFYGMSGVYFGTNVKNSFYYERVNFEFKNNQSLQFVETVSIGEVNILDLEFGWKVGLGSAFYLKNNQSVFFEIQYINGRNNFPKDDGFHLSNQSLSFFIGYNFYRGDKWD